MTENDRDSFVLYIYRYRSDLPFINSENLKIEQIARWSDDYISKYYYYLRHLQELYSSLPKEQVEEEHEVNDTILASLLNENEDNFLGPREPNEVQKVLDRYKNRRL